MKNIFKQISMHKSTLSEHSFCLYLRETDNITKMSFGFVPTMTFFVLGFRDILETMRIKNPKTAAEKMLNKHCEEDSEHWRWLIDDLNTLGMNIEDWGGDVSSILYKPMVA